MTTPKTSTLLYVAGTPSERMKMEERNKSVLIERLATEYAMRVPPNRKQRLYAFTKKLVSDKIPAGVVPSKNSICEIETAVRVEAKRLENAPPTPPRPKKASIFGTDKSAAEYEKERMRRLRREHQNLLSNRRAFGTVEPPSLTRMRQELHAAARSGAHRASSEMSEFLGQSHEEYLKSIERSINRDIAKSADRVQKARTKMFVADQKYQEACADQVRQPMKDQAEYDRPEVKANPRFISEPASLHSEGPSAPPLSASLGSRVEQTHALHLRAQADLEEEKKNHLMVSDRARLLKSLIRQKNVAEDAAALREKERASRAQDTRDFFASTRRFSATQNTTSPSKVQSTMELSFPADPSHYEDYEDYFSNFHEADYSYDTADDYYDPGNDSGENSHISESMDHPNPSPQIESPAQKKEAETVLKVPWGLHDGLRVAPVGVSRARAQAEQYAGTREQQVRFESARRRDSDPQLHALREAARVRARVLTATSTALHTAKTNYISEARKNLEESKNAPDSGVVAQAVRRAAQKALSSEGYAARSDPISAEKSRESSFQFASQSLGAPTDSVSAQNGRNRPVPSRNPLLLGLQGDNGAGEPKDLPKKKRVPLLRPKESVLIPPFGADGPPSPPVLPPPPPPARNPLPTGADFCYDPADEYIGRARPARPPLPKKKVIWTNEGRLVKTVSSSGSQESVSRPNSTNPDSFKEEKGDLSGTKQPWAQYFDPPNGSMSKWKIHPSLSPTPVEQRNAPVISPEMEERARIRQKQLENSRRFKEMEKERNKGFHASLAGSLPSPPRQQYTGDRYWERGVDSGRAVADPREKQKKEVEGVEPIVRTSHPAQVVAARGPRSLTHLSTTGNALESGDLYEFEVTRDTPAARQKKIRQQQEEKAKEEYQKKTRVFTPHVVANSSTAGSKWAQFTRYTPESSIVPPPQKALPPAPQAQFFENEMRQPHKGIKPVGGW